MPLSTPLTRRRTVHGNGHSRSHSTKSASMSIPTSRARSQAVGTGSSGASSYRPGHRFTPTMSTSMSSSALQSACGMPPTAPTPAPAPAPISRPLSRHSSIHSYSRSGAHSPTRSSFRSKAASPSRLPSTDSVSYFPPFEVMGSVCSSDSDAEGSSTGDSEREKERERAAWQKHEKVRSLGSIGSIAGFVSSITWGLSSLCTSPPPKAPARKGHKHSASTSSIPDKSVLPVKLSTHAIQVQSQSQSLAKTGDEAIHALTRSLSTKRRVLEHTALVDHCREPNAGSKGMHKRRMRSEVEVEALVESVLGAKEVAGQDEMAVEDLIGGTPSIARSTSRRRPRITLQVPLPAPAWRFPIPSPPVTSLSPNIPTEAFSTAVDNPLSPRLVQPHGSPGIMMVDLLRGRQRDLDQVEYELSPSISPTIASSSQPSTPLIHHHRPLIGDDDDVSDDEWIISQEHVQEWVRGKHDRVKRRGSEMSVKSEGTVKALWLGDITPKAKVRA